VAPLFRAWLDEHFTDRAAKVMHTIQSMRGGKDYDSAWFTRMTGTGPYAELLRRRFDVAVKKHGLNETRVTLRTDLFEPPSGPQLRLF
jgi:DNA repair photolyase